MKPDGGPSGLDMGSLNLGMEMDGMEDGMLAGSDFTSPDALSPNRASMGVAASSGDFREMAAMSLPRAASSPQPRFGKGTTSAPSSGPAMMSSIGPLAKIGKEVGTELNLDTVEVDTTGDLRMKMDLLGRGSDGARSHAAGKAGHAAQSGDVGSRRRSRSTLPANFRLSFDPSGINPPNVVLAGAEPQDPGAHAAGARGPGVSVREVRGSGMSAKEMIADEEEHMAMSMSLYGNPFGPRVGNQQILNTYSWLADQPGIPENSEMKLPG
eukprot:CAMPEP_0181331418 /NCGR_PEP_ID=MMETSP1101-20121128/24485_1 /TAXON_ID=46948 /ORGANISM="Rhodomonas abbreviata, Strain Caron Lab Isolate" /LENGTH=267 /DNA_ID=CAMNT_0023440865 /DNA_START=419 /DNA_END=1219 /DNA_ORIENTATION=-